jgi:hypothetical protein
MSPLRRLLPRQCLGSKSRVKEMSSLEVDKPFTPTPVARRIISGSADSSLATASTRQRCPTSE